MMNDLRCITFAVGIAISLIYDWRTGYGSGGLISAGAMALMLGNPQSVAFCLGSAVLLTVPLRFAAARWGLHGRARIGWAMLLALLLRYLASRIMSPLPWIGMVIPGLIAADMQKQGVLNTILALITVSVMTAFVSQFLFQAGGMIL